MRDTPRAEGTAADDKRLYIALRRVRELEESIRNGTATAADRGPTSPASSSQHSGEFSPNRVFRASSGARLLGVPAIGGAEAAQSPLAPPQIGDGRVGPPITPPPGPPPPVAPPPLGASPAAPLIAPPPGAPPPLGTRKPALVAPPLGSPPPPGAPPPPTPPPAPPPQAPRVPPKQKRAPSVPMRPLHWSKIADERVGENTLWRERGFDDGYVDLNIGEIEAAFGIPTPGSADGAPTLVRRASVGDGRAAKVCAIYSTAYAIPHICATRPQRLPSAIYI